MYVIFMFAVTMMMGLNQKLLKEAVSLPQIVSNPSIILLHKLSTAAAR